MNFSKGSSSLFIVVGFVCALFYGCKQDNPPTITPPAIDVQPAEDLDLEAREDSLELIAAYARQALIIDSFAAVVETASARADKMADAADDPAIWLNSTAPEKSLVFGSNKTGGLAAYNLVGEEVAYYPIGNVNNVDIMYGVNYKGEKITLLGCSNRTEQSINLFQVNSETGELTNIANGILQMDPLKIDDVYGFCFGRVADDAYYAIVNGKNGRLQQFSLVETAKGLDLSLAREIVFPSQTEGMVADNALGWLYVGEEAVGIWKMPFQPTSNDTMAVAADKVATLLNGRVNHPASITADVEGISLYESPTGTEGYLLVSSQGNFSYAVFDRGEDNTYLGSFKITDGNICDGVEETDGLDVVSAAIPGFPKGMLVVQDGFNYDGDSIQPQNFKYLGMEDILAWLERLK